MVAGKGDDQLWGAIAGCRCSVLWWGWVTTNFEGVDVVPLITQLVLAIWGLWYNFVSSPLFGEMFPKLTDIFQMGWFNHQLEMKGFQKI